MALRIVEVARTIAGIVATGILVVFLLVLYGILGYMVLYGVLYTLHEPAFSIVLGGFILAPLLIVAGALWFKYKRGG
ncbi:MAG: hypothetical protein ACE5EW_03975 [Thermoplasmata archaeon]